MADLSKMSTEELLAAYNSAKPKPKLAPQEQIQLKEAREAAALARDIASKGDQFLEINRKRGTGELIGVNLPFGLGGVSEAMAPFSEDISAMQAITNQMAPSLRAPGSGAMSDKDVALFKRSVPNVDFPGPTNTKIVARLKADAERQGARAKFLEDYVSRTGSLLGVEGAYQQFLAGQKKASANNKLRAKSAGSRGYKVLGVEN